MSRLYVHLYVHHRYNKQCCIYFNRMVGWLDGWMVGWLDGWMPRPLKLRLEV